MSELAPTGETEAKKEFGRPAKYPWQSWTNGNPWYLSQGTDYDSKTEAIRINLYSEARKRALALVVQVDRVKDGILFQFYPKHEEPPKLPSLANVRPPDADIPTCRVCGKANPAYAEFGEHVQYDADRGQFVSSHTGEVWQEL